MSNMAKAIVPNAVVLEVLEKDNYIDWSDRVKTYLLSEDLWNVVDGTSVEPPKPENNGDDHDQYKIWEKQNAKALHAIKISCGSYAFSFLRGIGSAKVAWDRLAHKFTSRQLKSLLKELETDMFPLQVEIINEGDEQSNVVDKEESDPFHTFLVDAVGNGKLEDVREILGQHPDWVRKRDPHSNGTALHCSIIMGKVDIVKELVQHMTEDDLEILNETGGTALHYAALNGDVCLARPLVEKNKRLLSISDTSNAKIIPVQGSFSLHRIEMTRYLCSVVPDDDLWQCKAVYSGIITKCIDTHKCLDIVMYLLRRCPALTIVANLRGLCPILVLANTPSAFYSGCHLNFWQQLIYRCLHIDNQLLDGVDIGINNQYLEDPQSSSNRMIFNILGSGAKRIYEMKRLHLQSRQIFRLMCIQMRNLLKSPPLEEVVCRAAVDVGIVEVVEEMYGADKQTFHLYINNDMGRNIVMCAIQSRQVKMFRLLSCSIKEDIYREFIDELGNNMLHIAGMLAPSTQLNRISGAALQMQYELQWFKEVMTILPPHCMETKNNDQERPRDVFTKNHKNLLKEGEKWMKEAATSCTVVGALIITIMFAAAFTVPGGNSSDDNASRHSNWYFIFVISDAISLFSSTTSVLMFLGILTSRYAEEDFLKSLPNKLIIGLSTLFVSVATMILSFCVVLFVMLKGNFWIYIMITSLAAVPITLFMLLQFPLLVELFRSTYGASLFHG